MVYQPKARKKRSSAVVANFEFLFWYRDVWKKLAKSWHRVCFNYLNFFNYVQNLLCGRHFYGPRNVIKTPSKISVSFGSNHIWRLYLWVNIISMSGGQLQHDNRSIGYISINFAHIWANKSSNGNCHGSDTKNC